MLIVRKTNDDTDDDDSDDSGGIYSLNGSVIYRAIYIYNIYIIYINRNILNVTEPDCLTLLSADKNRSVSSMSSSSVSSMGEKKTLVLGHVNRKLYLCRV